MNHTSQTIPFQTKHTQNIDHTRIFVVSNHNSVNPLRQPNHSSEITRLLMVLLFSFLVCVCECEFDVHSN